MKKYILGLHIGHDATVVLLEENNIVSAISEERFSRVKNHNGFPYRTLEYLVNKYNITSQNLSGIALTNKAVPAAYVTDILFGSEYQSESLFWSLPDKLAVTYHLNTLKRFIGGKFYSRYCFEYFNKKLKIALSRLGLDAEIYFFEHHLCHAASAYYSAGKEKILLITMDGLGDGVSATVNIGDCGIIKRWHSTPAIHSVGRYYSAVTDYLGFKSGNHEGKITGLAAFGDPEIYYDRIKSILGLNKDKISFRTNAVPRHLIYKKIYASCYAFKKRKFYDYGLESYKKEFGELDKKVSPENLAAAIQRRLEDVVADHIRAMADKFGIYDVGLSGGVFANVKLNQRIAQIGKLKSLFIHPNMGDAGLAFGAAFLLAKETSSSAIAPRKIDDVYWGPQYNDKEILEALSGKRIKSEKVKDGLEVKIASLLASGKVVAIFQGRMEYGPRALGNRSLLADPRDKNINSVLNKRLKRTEFMPFAPSIIEERASEILSDYDKFNYAAEFMTLTFDVRPDWVNRIQAVVHVDNTVRPQVVKKNINPRLYGIIKEFEKLTGIPALVNTSFNMHESPIVCSPEDAIGDFLQGASDILILEDIMVTKI